MGPWLYITVILIVTFSYTFLIIYIVRQWEKRSTVNCVPCIPIPVTIIIPARNEESLIEACLRSLFQNDYPAELMDIIVVDDYSEDNTAGVVKGLENDRVRLLSMAESGINVKNAYKKAAVLYGVQSARSDFIIQTDADTIFGQNYLKTMVAFYQQNNPVLVTGPVRIHPLHSFLGHFQALDMAGMMGLTAAGIASGRWFMANGANMAYEKRRYINLLDDDTASGDDIYMVNALARDDPGSVAFIQNRDAVVDTYPLDKFSDFVRQRLRWGTKNKNVNHPGYRVISIIPFAMALSILLQLPFLIINPSIIGPVLVFQVSVIAMINYVYLKEMSQFFRLHESMAYFLQAQLAQIVYLSFMGLASLFYTRFRWKGRTVK